MTTLETVETSPRPRTHELLELPAPPAPAQPVKQLPLPWRWTDASVEDLVQAVHDHCWTAGSNRGAVKPQTCIPMQGAQIVLDYLVSLPGDTWNDRWSLVDAQTAGGDDWRELMLPGGSRYARSMMIYGLGVLMVMDVFRPSYAWQHGRQLNIFNIVGEHRDPEGMRIVGPKIDQVGNPGIVKQVRQSLGRIQLHTGKSIRQITAEDLLDLSAALAELSIPSPYRRAVEHLWRVLTELGWITHESIVWPAHRVRKPQLSPEELVDHYGISGPQRDVLIEYLKQRRAALDYSTFRNTAAKLLKNFWRDVTQHHPDLPSFALTRDQADGWKQRLRTTGKGADRVGTINELFVVRSFYLDMAQWALEDSYWAPWAAPSPVTRAEVSGYSKLRRTQVARTQQRTRQLAPVMPQLVAQAARDRRDSKGLLARAVAASPGAVIDVDGEEWTVRRVRPTAPIRIDRAGESRNLSYEEDAAFWTWAAVETLRLTGIRCEELLELTHVSIVPYRVPATREEIPLLHIAPSKTDEERLLVAGPELVDVLAAVIHRVREGQQDLPLTQRWDQADHQLSEPLPHLFCRRFGPELRTFSAATLTKMLHDLARRANIRINGQSATFTAHDFRRVFATEALASGLPPHIVQVLLGHKGIATTQVYAAVYPQDVIRHHRTWISQRRLQRPSEEYRQPTPAEWEEFEGHFVKRKVSLGTCGRAYGTNCHHEHACVRCALLRPDPAQADRFRDIIANLGDRIAEAEQNNWLGEVEGLKVSLGGAKDKLAQMEQQLPQTSLTDLAMPTFEPRAVGQLQPPYDPAASRGPQ